jgi:hypothetical protein
MCKLKIRKSLKVLVVTTLASTAGVTAGAIVASATNPAHPKTQAVDVNDPEAKPFEYPVNKEGLTYGSLADATSERNTPDLVLVELADGSTGYISSSELQELEESGSKPNSPEEAVHRQSKRDAQGPVELTVYDVDGTTVLGSWQALTTDE